MQPKLPNCSAAPSCTLKQAIIATAKKTAWIQGADNAAFWQKRIGRGCIRLAAQNDRILGFIEYLPEQNHLDCLFTDPAHQRQGVASALLSAVLPQADADKTVTADVSAAAFALF